MQTNDKNVSATQNNRYFTNGTKTATGSSARERIARKLENGELGNRPKIVVKTNDSKKENPVSIENNNVEQQLQSQEPKPFNASDFKGKPINEWPDRIEFEDKNGVTFFANRGDNHYDGFVRMLGGVVPDKTDNQELVTTIEPPIAPNVTLSEEVADNIITKTTPSIVATKNAEYDAHKAGENEALHSGTNGSTQPPIAPNVTLSEDEKNDPAIDDITRKRRVAARTATYNDIYNRWKRNGEGVYMYNGTPHVMLNGKAVPMIDNYGNVLDTDGAYKKIDDNGSLANREGNTETDELLQNMFDYFDANNGDTKSVSDPDFIITESGGALGGTTAMRNLANNFGIDTNKFGWKRALLNQVKKEYTDRRSNQRKYFDEFDRGNIVLATDDVVLQDDNGNNDVISKDELNTFFQKCKEFHTKQKTNPAMYKLNQEYVKDFQQYMNQFMETHPAAKEAVQNGIRWTGANGEKFPIDGHYGQNTTSVMWNILGLLGGEDALAMVGAKYNPETDEVGPDIDGINPVNDWIERRSLISQERHEQKRNERQGVFNNIANLITGIGDIIGGSQGVEVKDRAQEIAQDAKDIEDRRTQIKKDFDAKMIDLKDKQQKARTEIAQRRYALRMEMLKQKFQANQAQLDREESTKQKEADRLAQKEIAIAKMQNDKYIANLEYQGKIIASQIKQSGNVKFNSQAFTLNGNTVMCPSGSVNNIISRGANLIVNKLLDLSTYNTQDLKIDRNDSSQIELLRNQLSASVNANSTQKIQHALNALSQYGQKYPKLGKMMNDVTENLQKQVYQEYGIVTEESTANESVQGNKPWWQQ